MRKHTIAVAALLTVVTHPSVRAQSASAMAGWVGLISTPVGGLPPAMMVPVGDEAPPWGVRARYGHWQFAPDDDNTTNLGIGITFPAGEGRAAVEVGYTTKKGCLDCDAILLGVEFHMPLAATPLSGMNADDGPTLGTAVEPAFGYMTETASDADFNALSLAVSVPVFVTVPVGSSTRLAPFVSPGFGLGHVSGAGSSEGGGRMMTGFGIAFATRFLQVTASARKIFIEGDAILYGVSVSVGG